MPKFFKFEYAEKFIIDKIRRRREAEEKEANAALDEIISAVVYGLQHPQNEMPDGIRKIVSELRAAGIGTSASATSDYSLLQIERRVAEKYLPSKLETSAHTNSSKTPIRTQVLAPGYRYDLIDFLDERRGLTPFSTRVARERRREKIAGIVIISSIALVLAYMALSFF